jgi:hypothetical protein
VLPGALQYGELDADESSSSSLVCFLDSRFIKKLESPWVKCFVLIFLSKFRKMTASIATLFDQTRERRVDMIMQNEFNKETIRRYYLNEKG